MNIDFLFIALIYSFNFAMNFVLRKRVIDTIVYIINNNNTISLKTIRFCA